MNVRDPGGQLQIFKAEFFKALAHPVRIRILEILVRNAGRLVTRQTLLQDIWGSEHVTDTGYLRLYLSQLRKKLEPDPAAPRYLLTDPGMGYRFDPSGGGA